MQKIDRRLMLQDVAIITLALLISRLFFLAIAAIISPERPHAEALCTYDCNWYVNIAVEGYGESVKSNGQASWAFFPLFPLLTHFMIKISGWTNVVSALVLNNIGLFISAMLLYTWGARRISAPVGLYSALILVVSPFSIYFSVPYTESMFLLFTLACFFSARESHWLLAGLMGMCAAATRNLGVFLVFPLALIALQQIGWRKLLQLDAKAGQALLGIMLIPAGLIAYMYFLDQLIGNPFAFKDAQVAWDRHIGNPFTKLIVGLKQIDNVVSFSHALGALAGIALLAWAIRAKYYAEALFFAFGIFIPLSTSVVAMPRYVAVHFIVYLLIGEWLVRHPKGANLILAACGGGLIFMVTSWVLSRGYMI